MSLKAKMEQDMHLEKAKPNKAMRKRINTLMKKYGLRRS